MKSGSEMNGASFEKRDERCGSETLSGAVAGRVEYRVRRDGSRSVKRGI